MVKIETQESRNGLDLVVGPDVEFSAEGGVGEVGGLVVPCTFLVLYAAKVFCLCPGIRTCDVVVGIEYGDALVGFRVCYRGLEERESWAFEMDSRAGFPYWLWLPSRLRCISRFSVIRSSCPV